MHYSLENLSLGLTQFFVSDKVKKDDFKDKITKHNKDKGFVN